MPVYTKFDDLDLISRSQSVGNAKLEVVVSQDILEYPVCFAKYDMKIKHNFEN